MARRDVSYSFWGESEDDDITKLPQHYEAKATDDNRVYFIKYACKLGLLFYISYVNLHSTYPSQFLCSAFPYSTTATG